MTLLIRAWLAARSINRSLPAPVPDQGGWRVDSRLPEETARYVFAASAPGLRDLAHQITAPLHFIKLCGSGAQLRQAAPPHWQLSVMRHVMTRHGDMARHDPPACYRLEYIQTGPVHAVRVVTDDGDVAASGFAVEHDGVFVYDRIGTQDAHRRRGLGRAVMSALGRGRNSAHAQQILVATDEGRALYGALGWGVVSPFATISIPALPG